MIVDTRTQTADRPTTAAHSIDVQAVTKEFGDGESRVQILKGVDLAIAKGEMLAIMGPSGSGKSTLLGCISGLDTVTGGTVIINGTDITRLGENALASVRNRNIGFVFQTSNLITTLTAQENVELPTLGARSVGGSPSRDQTIVSLVHPDQDFCFWTGVSRSVLPICRFDRRNH